MDTSGTPGEITVTTAYGASSGTDIVLSYSTDGITYTGAVSVGAGAGKTIATGQTSGFSLFKSYCYLYRPSLFYTYNIKI